MKTLTTTTFSKAGNTMKTITITQEDWNALSRFVSNYNEEEGTMDSIMLRIACNKDYGTPYFDANPITKICENYFDDDFSALSKFIQENCIKQRVVDLHVEGIIRGIYKYALEDDEDPDTVSIDYFQQDDLYCNDEEYNVEDVGDVTTNYSFITYQSYIASMTDKLKVVA